MFLILFMESDFVFQEHKLISKIFQEYLYSGWKKLDI